MEMLPARIEMTKAGEITPRFIKAGPKCDIAESDTYRYQVFVIATDESLDENGFIIDNVEIPRILELCFDGREWMSCERMAVHAARSLLSFLLDRRISVLSVKTMIGGSNGAWLSATAEHQQAR